MSTLAVIPARLGARRLTRKPLRLLGGVPLIVRVWQRISQLGVADRCVIASDSDEVAAAARGVGAECVITAATHPSGTDRVAEVVAMPGFDAYDVIVNVQGDEPFVPAAAVLGAAQMVTSKRFTLGTAATAMGQRSISSPHVVKVVSTDDGRAMYFSRAEIPCSREAEGRTLQARFARQHIGVYAYTRDALAQWVILPQHPLEQIERLEQLRPLAAGMAMGVALIDEIPPGGIDTEDDLAHANEIWPHFIQGRPLDGQH
ncbi:MAG: 3-deoxy-manno-octulosonate cytidylyltransferase [Gemmatimonadaceae bacterium]